MTTIYVICHKRLAHRLDAPLTPIFVGDIQPEFGALSDKTGDSISEKNSSFCELTAQYWVWKNLLIHSDPNEIVGFCHYRRYFTLEKKAQNWDDLKSLNIDAAICKIWECRYDAIISRSSHLSLDGYWYYRSLWLAPIKLGKFKRPGSSLTIEEHYRLCHIGTDLELAASLLPEKHRDKFSSYLLTSDLSGFNMYIAGSGALCQYFSILFPWLFAVEQQLELKNRDAYQKRVFGFLAERFSGYYFSHFHQAYQSEVTLISA